MKLTITNQTNEQECGVCVITSLHNYFYHSKIVKEDVLDKSRITHYGMSIFDFEILAKEAGLECESYEIQWSEFANFHIEKFFVALISMNNCQDNHYVIVKKSKKHFTIYDSCSTAPLQLNYEQFKKIFLNVIILIAKKPNKIFNKVFSNTKTLLMFDLKFVLLNLLLSFLILCISIVSAGFLNWIIDSSITKSSINNLITISFVFLLVYFSNDILTYISNIYVSGQMKNYYLLFTNKILSSIEFKKPDFLSKVDKNWIYKVDECVYNIVNFSILEINKFITNIIFCTICVCVIGSIQVYLLIFVLLFGLVEFIPFLFSYRKKKELFSDVVKNENKNSQYYKNLIDSLSNETWLAKRQSSINSIKNNYSKIYKNFNDAIVFKSNNDLIKGLFKSFTEVSLIACASYLIIKYQALSIGKLTFVIATFTLLKNSIAETFNYFLAKLEFNIYWQVYKDLTNVSNLSCDEKKIKDSIKSIQFIKDSTVYRIDVSNKSNDINLRIQTLLTESQIIKFDDLVIQSNSKELFERVIIVDEFSHANKNIFLDLLNLDPNLYASYLRYFQIDINEQLLSFDNNNIINLLCLLHEKKKIIIIDSILDYIKPKDKIIVREILNKIRLNNDLFIVGKEKRC